MLRTAARPPWMRAGAVPVGRFGSRLRMTLPWTTAMPLKLQTETADGGAIVGTHNRVARNDQAERVERHHRRCRAFWMVGTLPSSPLRYC
jgi:hypothetical protein